jgi:hypothetical protein
MDDQRLAGMAKNGLKPPAAVREATEEYLQGRGY